MRALDLRRSLTAQESRQSTTSDMEIVRRLRQQSASMRAEKRISQDIYVQINTTTINMPYSMEMPAAT